MQDDDGFTCSGDVPTPISTIPDMKMLAGGLPMVTESRLEYVNRQSLIQNTAPSCINTPQAVPK